MNLRKERKMLGSVLGLVLLATALTGCGSDEPKGGSDAKATESSATDAADPSAEGDDSGTGDGTEAGTGAAPGTGASTDPGTGAAPGTDPGTGAAPGTGADAGTGPGAGTTASGPELTGQAFCTARDAALDQTSETEYIAALKAIRPPAALANDWSLVVAAEEGMMVGAAGMGDGSSDDFAKLEALLTKYATPEVEAATAKIDDYEAANCVTGTG